MDLFEKTRAALIECGAPHNDEIVKKAYDKFHAMSMERVKDWVAANMLIGGTIFKDGKMHTPTEQELLESDGAQVVLEMCFLDLLKQMQMNFYTHTSQKTHPKYG